MAEKREHMPDSRQDFTEGLVSLYHLLINADGRVDNRELAAGAFMCRQEGIPQDLFERRLAEIAALPREHVLRAGIDALKRCSREEQLRCLAWISHLTNADGYMDSEEWKLLYRIYHKSLRLKLQDILDEQSRLPRN
jgi:hypothetical protein